MPAAIASPIRVSKFSSSLIELTESSDVIADLVIAELLTDGQLKGNLLDKVRGLAQVQRDENIYQHFLDSVDQVPGWFDQQAMARAGRLYLSNPLLTAIALLAGVSIDNYCYASIARAMARQSRAAHDVKQRFFETAQFIYTISQGALVPGSHGHSMAVNVRLLNATMRQVLKNQPPWSAEQQIPISQFDVLLWLRLLAVNMTRYLDTMGVQLDQDQTSELLHLWRYVGYLLGLPEGPLKEMLFEPEYVYFFESQIEVDEISRTLTHSLLKNMAGQTPFFLPRPILYELSRSFVGEQRASALAYPGASPWAAVLNLLPSAQRIISSLQKTIPPTKIIATFTGSVLAENIIRANLNPAA